MKSILRDLGVCWPHKVRMRRLLRIECCSSPCSQEEKSCLFELNLMGLRLQERSSRQLTIPAQVQAVRWMVHNIPIVEAVAIYWLLPSQLNLFLSGVFIVGTSLTSIVRVVWRNSAYSREVNLLLDSSGKPYRVDVLCTRTSLMRLHAAPMV